MNLYATALRSARKKNKTRQADIAEDLGLSQKYISRIETGTTFAKDIEEALAIASAAGLEPLEALSCFLADSARIPKSAFEEDLVRGDFRSAARAVLGHLE